MYAQTRQAGQPTGSAYLATREPGMPPSPSHQIKESGQGVNWAHGWIPFLQARQASSWPAVTRICTCFGPPYLSGSSGEGASRERPPDSADVQVELSSQLPHAAPTLKPSHYRKTRGDFILGSFEGGKLQRNASQYLHKADPKGPKLVPQGSTLNTPINMFKPEEELKRDLETKRPILSHLNADTTWLLSLAYPAHATPPVGRSRFNILIDPWLRGPQKDVAGWFSTQWHAIESAVQTIKELNQSLGHVERLDFMAESTAQEANRSVPSKSNGNFLDAVVISHEFTDHCHQATLQEIDRSVPVFATQKAAALIRSWKHFDQVTEIGVFQSDNWKASSNLVANDWLRVSRLITKSDALYYHSAVIFCIEGSSDSNNAEAVIYTPHGVESESFTALGSAQPPVQSLAFLHGLHDVSLYMTKQLNLGAHNALKAQRVLQPKYWVGTHDEVKKGGGLVSVFLRRQAHTLMDALSKEKPQKDLKAALDGQDRAPNFFELASGQSMLLD